MEAFFDTIHHDVGKGVVWVQAWGWCYYVEVLARQSPRHGLEIVDLQFRGGCGH